MKIKQIVTGMLATISIAYGNNISESQQKWVKHYERQKNIIPVEEALINQEKEPDLSVGFVDLYNGKDLDGWILRGGQHILETSDGVITGRCVPGESNGFLSTIREDFSDFIFTAEVKWEVQGNSGIMFRAQRKPVNGGEKVFGLQCEMEGPGNNRGWSGGIFGEGAGGWRYPLWLDAHKEARKALKKDDWNRITIKAVGKNVKTWINGIPAAHYEQDEYLEGFLGLQIHSGKKGTIHFRNIRVREPAQKK